MGRPLNQFRLFGIQKQRIRATTLFFAEGCSGADLNAICQFGYNYQKVGIILTDLVPADFRQKGVFVDGPDERLIKLVGVMDKLNYRYGQDKLRLASQQYNPEWPHAAAFPFALLYDPLEGYLKSDLAQGSYC